MSQLAAKLEEQNKEITPWRKSSEDNSSKVLGIEARIKGAVNEANGFALQKFQEMEKDLARGLNKAEATGQQLSVTVQQRIDNIEALLSAQKDQMGGLWHLPAPADTDA